MLQKLITSMLSITSLLKKYVYLLVCRIPEKKDGAYRRKMSLASARHNTNPLPSLCGRGQLTKLLIKTYMKLSLFLFRENAIQLKIYDCQILGRRWFRQKNPRFFPSDIDRGVYSSSRPNTFPQRTPILFPTRDAYFSVKRPKTIKKGQYYAYLDLIKMIKAILGHI